MSRWSSQRYLQVGVTQNIDKSVLNNAIQTAKILHNGSPLLPPIFSLRHFAHESGVPYGFLRGVVARRKIVEPYKVFKLKKNIKSFGKERYRYVCAPHHLLLKAQRWINKNILSKAIPHESSYAYRENYRVFDAASLHVKCTWLIKLDATNFFESILEPDIYKIFRNLGYQPLISFELARLCTRIRPTGNPIYTNRSDPIKSGLPYNSIEIGHLPQGAATSPLLSNLASRSLDEKLADFANSNSLVYTRYADDLTFSSKASFDRADTVRKIREIYQIMQEQGLWPNKSKTRIIPPGARKIVLGLLVDGTQPTLTKEFKEEVRTHIHFMLRKDIGVKKHISTRRFDTFWGMRNYLYGKLAYAQSIEPYWAEKMKSLAKNIDWSS